MRTILRSRLPVAALLLLGAGAAASCATPPASEEDAAPENAAAAGPDRPALAVMVVVDQLRGDLLSRYDDLFTGGFRRLLDEGALFVRASHDHVPTYTAPGHATLATGVFPATHGVVANDFWTEEQGRVVRRYSVEDAASPVLGFPDARGLSPVHLLAPGIGEWISAADPDARILSVSKKDRSAITLAGRVPGAHVYWIDEGRFVTSRWYRDRYPAWVDDFNDEATTLSADTVWRSTVPAGARHRSRPDTFPMEGDGVHTHFPHRAWQEAGEGGPGAVRSWIADSPATDAAVLELVKRGMRQLGLGGRDGGLDYLAVGFSAADYVGHDYGPLSREQLDNLLRLDRLLGELLELLDERVGEGRWVMAFSADHGVLTYPEWGGEEGGPGVPGVRGVRLGWEEGRDIDRAVARAAEGGARGEALAAVARELPRVAAVYLREELGARSEPADSFIPLYRNAYREDRWASREANWGIQIRLDEGVLRGRSGGGTTHGSPYWYDRWVPLAFLGAGVRAGVAREAVSTVDAAPTLADLLRLSAPPGVDGRSLLSPGGR